MAKHSAKPDPGLAFWLGPRRDICERVGRRARRLSPAQAAEAWYELSRRVEELNETDVPKFRDIIIAIRVAHLSALKRLARR